MAQSSRPAGRPTNESASRIPVIPPKTVEIPQPPKLACRCPHCLNTTVPRIRHVVKNERAGTQSKYCRCSHCALDYRVDFDQAGAVVAIKRLA